jgi:hypothetical protein
MELKGKVIAKTPMETGTSSSGKEWHKLTIAIEEQSGQYPKKQAIVFMNDKAKEADVIQIGADLTVQINIESREYNSKWYTDVKGWKFEVQNNNAAPNYGVNTPTQPAENLPAPEPDGSDLPF